MNQHNHKKQPTMSIKSWIKKAAENVVAFVEGVPANVKKIAQNVLRFTTALLAAMEAVEGFLDSDVAKMVTAIIPGDEDERIRVMLVEALRPFVGQLKQAKNRKERKRIMGQVGAMATAKLDEYKQGDAGVYALYFKKVYEQTKA